MTESAAAPPPAESLPSSTAEVAGACATAERADVLSYTSATAPEESLPAFDIEVPGACVNESSETVDSAPGGHGSRLCEAAKEPKPCRSDAIGGEGDDGATEGKKHEENISPLVVFDKAPLPNTEEGPSVIRKPQLEPLDRPSALSFKKSFKSMSSLASGSSLRNSLHASRWTIAMSDVLANNPDTDANMSNLAYLIQYLLDDQADAMAKMLSRMRDDMDMLSQYDVGHRTFYHTAVIANASKCLRVLLKRGKYRSSIGVNEADNRGMSALHYACTLGRLECIRSLLEIDEVDVNKVDKWGRVPLMYALARPTEDAAVMMFNAAMDIDFRKRDHEGHGMLHYVCMSKMLPRKQVVAFLLQHSRVPADVPDRNGYTGAHAAVLGGDIVVVRKILRLQRDAFLIANDKGVTCLMTAVQRGSLEIIAAMLSTFQTCESLLRTDDTGRGIMHYAGAAGNALLCQLLIDMGLGAHELDVNGMTPVMLAASQGHASCIVALVDGFSPCECNSFGENILHLAVRAQSLECVQMIIDTFPEIIQELLLAYNDHGHAPIHIASMGNNEQILRMLTEVKVSKNSWPNLVTEDSGLKCIHLAACTNKSRCIQVQLNHGVHVDSRDTKGYTALIHAVIQGNFEIVDFLLENGADVDAVDCAGFNPLFYAVDQNHYEILKRLLRAEPCVNKIFDNPTPSSRKAAKMTIMNYAVDLRRHACINILVDFGATRIEQQDHKKKGEVQCKVQPPQKIVTLPQPPERSVGDVGMKSIAGGGIICGDLSSQDGCMHVYATDPQGSPAPAGKHGNE